MKYILLLALLYLIISCNSSADNKIPVNKAGDNSRLVATTSDTTAIAVTPPARLTPEQVPVSIKFRGNLQEAWQWNDRLGENILITSLVPPYPDKEKNEYGEEEEGESSELYAFHFIKRDNSYKVLWQITDAEKACPFDLTVSFLKDGVVISDLDGDGIAETCIQYKKACRSDVSPAYMKVIMHEDTLQYTLRGLMWVFDGGNGKFNVTEADVNLEKQPKLKEEAAQMYQLYGRYQTEKEFANAPAVFLSHARSQWLKFAKESFD